MSMSQEEMRNAVAYIEKARWQFAKSMPKLPHWYTVVTWSGADEVGFRLLANMIEQHGQDEQFYGRVTRYLYIGEWKYWIMSAPYQCVLINRAQVDDKVGQ